MPDYSELVDGIVASVGGADNIASTWHCATRLRMELKDWSAIDKEALTQIPAVAGISEIKGEQLQVIIGPRVAAVHDALASRLGTGTTTTTTATAEKPPADRPKAKRNVGSTILNAVSKTFIPVIEIIVAASLIKLIATVIGPGMLAWVSADNDLYRLFTFVGDAGFYFLPIFIGMSAARTFGSSQMLGMFVGAIYLSPGLIAIVESGEPFSVYGIPMTLTSYANATIPALLTVWLMSYVERFFRRIVPESLRMMLVPFLTILVILPVALCAVGPLATWLGNAIAAATLALASTSYFAYVVVGTIIGGIFILGILFGIHVPLFVIAAGLFATNGYDDLILRGLYVAIFALMGMEIGAFLRLKRPADKSLAGSYLLTHFVGGISEPAIFGIGVRYRRPLIATCIGGAVGSLFCGLFGVKIYTLIAVSNVVSITAFLGGPMSNAVLGFIGSGIALITAGVLTYFFGFKRADIYGEETVELASAR